MPTYPAGPGITRFELDSRRHGYMVRICRDGKKTNEFFADRLYGGKRKAKKLAQQRYLELCESLGPVSPSTKNRLTHRNSTGVVGVHVASSVDTRWDNGEYTSYCASWVDEKGKRQKISFSWNKYGQTAAFELACLARKLESTDRSDIVKRYERRVRRRKQTRQAAKIARAK